MPTPFGADTRLGEGGQGPGLFPRLKHVHPSWSATGAGAYFPVTQGPVVRQTGRCRASALGSSDLLATEPGYRHGAIVLDAKQAYSDRT